MSTRLTERQVAQFREDGFLILPEFYPEKDILQIQRGIYDVIGQVMIKNGVIDAREPFSAENFDQAYLELIKKNRSWGGEIYDGIKQIPAFVRLVAQTAHEDILAEIRLGAQPGLAAGGYGIRIDNPNEDRFRAMWHQEYPAQLRSIDGVVFWSPLVPVAENLGPVRLCRGSHLGGPLPVCDVDAERTSRTGAYRLEIHDEKNVIAQYEQVAPLTRPRDLILIDFLTLHASGINTSDRSRWSMQFRFFNFAEPTGRGHAWSGSYAAGVDFREIHPELFIT